MASKEMKFNGYVWLFLGFLSLCLPHAPQMWTAVYVIIAFVHFVGAEILKELGH